MEYKFVVYSAQGKKLAEFEAYKNALGIKSINWSPNGIFLGVGSYDQTTRVFNTLTWRIVAQFKCQSKILPIYDYKNAVSF